MKLNPKQQYFCELYASHREFFGNGTQSYIEAYDVDVTKKGSYASARTKASILLTKGNILEVINNLLEVSTLNDVAVDKQLAFLVAQNADFTNKLGAIKEYNKIKQRITEKIEVTEKVEIDLSSYSTEDLEKAIEGD